ncbi:MAG: lysophospholipid acyltransferase family protein [Bacteroidetes bacterium]|nr:lysophospholipid acyltransferase family protein [Bacteroidota bacterium]
MLYWLSDFLFFVGYRLMKYRRSVVLKNLRNSFPTASEKELHVVEKEFYQNLCDYAVETIKLLSIQKEELTKRMSYQNPEVLQPYADKKQSVILLASHQFNWEWLMVSGSINLPLPIDFVYQKQSSTSFDHFLMQIRCRFGAYAIERGQTARESIRRKNISKAVAIIADQFPNFEKKVWTSFLHQDTAFFQGIGQLAVLTQYPAFFVRSKKIKRGYYQAELIPIATPPYNRDSQTLVENYAQLVEHFITENPASWLWSHERWKRKREES